MSKLYTLEEIIKHNSSRQIHPAYTFSYLVEGGHSLPNLKSIWGNYIFENGLIHFPSLRGSAKSLLMMQICLAVASNQTKFLGEIIEMNGKTLFIDFEMPDFFLKRRAYKLYKGSPFNLRPYVDDFLVFSTRQSFEASFDTIIKLIVQEKPILIVIDNLRTAIKGSNTNSAVDMTNFFTILGGIREIYQVAIVVIDHLRKGTKNLKSDSDLQSGSGVKTDLSDGDFQIRHSSQSKDLRLIKRLKSRMFEESDKTKLVKLNPETLWFELVDEDVNESEHIFLNASSDKEELIDLAQDLKKNGKSYQEIAQILAKPKTTIYRWLNQQGDSS